MARIKIHITYMTTKIKVRDTLSLEAINILSEKKREKTLSI